MSPNRSTWPRRIVGSAVASVTVSRPLSIETRSAPDDGCVVPAAAQLSCTNARVAMRTEAVSPAAAVDVIAAELCTEDWIVRAASMAALGGTATSVVKDPNTPLSGNNVTSDAPFVYVH